MIKPCDRTFGKFRRYFAYILLACLCLVGTACAPGMPSSQSRPGIERLEFVGYSVQAGAFAVADNAAGLMRRLESQGLSAYYFRDQDGLYKVRFGSFPDRESAKERAVRLASRGVLRDYFVVDPQSYSAAWMPRRGAKYLRRELVSTAKSFLGTPYEWGGTSERDGFDCSGLTMAVYRHNGLNLPRVADRQYRSGRPVSRSGLRKGDLVFFDTKRRGKPSHVGLYIGHGRFIHAASSGSVVTTGRLSKSYFRARFLGGRSYL
ncbi:MAG: NlpC/P60 family protein [Desulfohalobiaceae bacterium]